MVVPGSEPIGYEGNASRTQVQNVVFTHGTIISLNLLTEQVLECQVLANTGQGRQSLAIDCSFNMMY